ncbi:MAG: head-tail connector protein [Thermodesulfobacteriota bacterium]|jgi:uncharacterized phiE125 gp8 family phage protein
MTSRALITAPAAEPVSLAEAKLHLRVEHAADDALITALIQAARERAEAITRRALISQTWEVYLDEWPSEGFIRLPMPPLQSVASVKYTDTDGVEHTFSDWAADVASLPGRVVLNHGAAWPSVTLRPVNPIAVRFVAGYGDAAAVPASIKAAMLLMIGHLYENREESVAGVSIAALPMGAEALLAPFRLVEF